MVGYYTAEQDFATHYADPAYKKDKMEYIPKLFDLSLAERFVKERSREMGALMKAQVHKVREAHFTVMIGPRLCGNGDCYLAIQCVMAAQEALTEDEEDILDSIGAEFLRKLSKEFNRQPFTETEYGSVKMPGRIAQGFKFEQGPINTAYIMMGRR